MTLPAITFASGHQLVDNGAGDYCFQCPDGHKHRPTAYPHQVSDISRHPERWACDRCRVPIGERTGGEPYSPPLVDPWTCEHAPMQILSDEHREVPGAVERIVRFRCGKCGATIEQTDYSYPAAGQEPPEDGEASA